MKKVKSITPKLLLAFLVFIQLYSCKKEVSTSLIVTVYDEGVHRNLANRNIVLVEDLNPPETIIAEGTTDANGQVNFGSFMAVKNRKYKYFARDRSSAYISNTDAYFNAGESNNVTIRENNPTVVNVNLLPPPPYPSGDSLSIHFYDYVNHPHGSIWDINSSLYHVSGNYQNYKTTTVFPATYTVIMYKYHFGTLFSTTTNTYDFTQLDTTYNINYNVTW